MDMRVTGAETVRAVILMPTALDQVLADLAARGGTTKEDILAKSIALYEVLASATERNNRVAILDPQKVFISEITGF